MQTATLFLAALPAALFGFGGLGGSGVLADNASAGIITQAVQGPLLIDAVTFGYKPGVLFVPLREVAQALGAEVHWDAAGVIVEGRALSTDGPKLLDGTVLVPLGSLRDLGFTVEWLSDSRKARLAFGGRELFVQRGKKRAVINKSEQEIRAWEGARLVFQSRVSTGRRGYRTPSGDFRAGPYKAKMHRSSLYDNAPMPWSVQIVGNIFVHGYDSVPSRPASHGCIRLPLEGDNPAKWFYNWVDVGTPVSIMGKWPKRS